MWNKGREFDKLWPPFRDKKIYLTAFLVVSIVLINIIFIFKNYEVLIFLLFGTYLLNKTIKKTLQSPPKWRLFVKFYLFFNWRITALHNFVVFCQISAWIIYRYTYVPSLLNVPPSPSPSHPSRLIQSPCLGSLRYTAISHWLSVLHTPNKTREDSTHGHHQMVNTEIRFIIFFAAKDGEGLYSQQKQDRELTVAQIMNSLLPNSDWNWRK